MMMSHTVAPEMMAFIHHNALPTVLVASGSHGEIPTVDIDNRKAAYDAVSCLIREGHRRIAMVSGPVSDLSGGLARQTGYWDAMREHGCPVPKDYVQIGCDYTYHTGYEKMEKLLALSNAPTAVFLAGDYLAIGAIKAARSLGVSVPGQLAVMGFDNLAVSQYCAPPLSTVNQPRYEMGREAMRLLFARLLDEPMEQTAVILPHEVFLRQSTELKK